MREPSRTVLQVFAIRHKPTGKWMPARVNATAGGWSYWNPTSDDVVRDGNPRVFFTLRSAQNALTAWLMGEHSRKQGVHVDWEGIPDGYDDHVVNAPRAPRHRGEMEIVSFTLKEGDTHA